MKIAEGEVIKAFEGYIGRGHLSHEEVTIALAESEDFQDDEGDEICYDLFGPTPPDEQFPNQVLLAAEVYLSDRIVIKHIYGRILSALPNDEYGWYLWPTSGPGRGVMKLTEIF